MIHVAIALAARLAGAHTPAEGPAFPVVDVLPGRDVGITPYARWSHPSRLHVAGVAGAELLVEEAVLLDVRSALAGAVLSVEMVVGRGMRAFELDVRGGGDGGRLDLLGPSPRSELGALQVGDVLRVGVRLKLAEDAHEARDVVLAWRVTG